MLNMLLWIGRMNDSNLFLKTDIDSELLIFSSRLNQSLKAEGKKDSDMMVYENFLFLLYVHILELN